MTVLDLSNVINVTVTDVPSGLPNVNINSVALLTNELPSNIDDYRVYLNSRDVATDYGTSSETYALANAIFSQNPNLLSGKGQLVVAPMESAVSATSGYWDTPDISANLVALIAVTDGKIRVTLNGTNNDLTGLNFTRCTTLADIAATLQKVLPDAIVTASSTAINFLSKKVGLTADVVVAQLSAGGGTDLSASGLLHTSTGTATSGTDSSGETVAEALIRVGALVSFVGFITNLQIEDDLVEETAAVVQPLNYIWIHTFASTTDMAGIINTCGLASYSKSRFGLYTSNLEDANLFRAAYLGGRFSVDFSASSTFSTPFLKQIVGLAPDSGITQNVYNLSQTYGTFTYDNFGYAGLSNPRFNSGGIIGKYFDEVYGDQWLVFSLAVAGFNTLAGTTTRIPQTEAGMDSIKANLIKILNQGVRVGFMATGLTWNSSNTFGDPATLVASVKAVGYYIYSLPIAEQSQIDRAARIAPTIQIAVKRAGGIQKVFVLVLAEA
ncbi:MAG: DUF3383 family protein [Flavobacterium sp.]